MLKAAYVSALFFSTHHSHSSPNFVPCPPMDSCFVLFFFHNNIKFHQGDVERWDQIKQEMLLPLDQLKVFGSQVDQIVMMFVVLYILMLVLSSLCKTDQE